MALLTRRTLLSMFASVAAASVAAPVAAPVAAQDNAETGPPLYPNETLELRRLINKYADLYEVPRPLVQRVVIRESTHRPGVTNGPYYGLMQILPATARSMGFAGKSRDLLDAETNLKYSVKYLRGAWLISDGSHDNAVKWYSRGYWKEAKRRGMLKETGLVN